MGHFYDKVQGIGRDQQAAQSEAIDRFLYENGHRYSVREVLEPKLLDRVPPTKEVREQKGTDIYISQAPDPDAPKDKWLERWQFTLHTHA